MGGARSSSHQDPGQSPAEEGKEKGCGYQRGKGARRGSHKDTRKNPTEECKEESGCQTRTKKSRAGRSRGRCSNENPGKDSTEKGEERGCRQACREKRTTCSDCKPAAKTKSQEARKFSSCKIRIEMIAEKLLHGTQSILVSF